MKSALLLLLLIGHVASAELQLYAGDEKVEDAAIDIDNYRTEFHSQDARITFNTSDGQVAVVQTLPTVEYLRLPFVYFENADCTGAASLDDTRSEIAPGTGIIGRNSTIYLSEGSHAQSLPRSRWIGSACEDLRAPTSAKTYRSIRPVRTLPGGDLQLGFNPVEYERAAMAANGVPIPGTQLELVDPLKAKSNSAELSRMRVWLSGVVNDEIDVDPDADEKWGLVWFATANAQMPVYMYLRFSDDSYPEEGFGLYRDVDQGLLFPTKDCSGDVAYYHTDTDTMMKSKIRGASLGLLGPQNTVFAETNTREDFVPKSFFRKSKAGGKCSSIWFSGSERRERFDLVHQFPAGDLTRIASDLP